MLYRPIDAPEGEPKIVDGLAWDRIPPIIWGGEKGYADEDILVVSNIMDELYEKGILECILLPPKPSSFVCEKPKLVRSHSKSHLGNPHASKLPTRSRSIDQVTY